MKRILSLLAAGLFLFETAATTNIFAAPSPACSHPLEAAGCLRQGPSAQEYVIQSPDSTTKGIYESRDLLLNNYVGKTVTVAGDPANHSSKDDEASHHMRAMDIVVENQGCQK